MKTIEETFKAEKEILEDFFKNRINFRDETVFENSSVFYSDNIFTYDDNIRDSVRISIKGVLLYLNSLCRINGQRWNEIQVAGKETLCLEYFPILLLEGYPILRLEESVVGNNDFLGQLDYEIYNAKMDDCDLYNVEPFNIVICAGYQNINHVDKKKVINIDKIFKTEECVICLLTKPNILYCNCGHICICNECNKIKKLNVCPVCRTENTTLRIIE